ncbi:MAG: hypothetical protein U0L51_09870 [Olegusella sp.]|nr:hypothetical protein [Olegusella sp.]
MAALDKRIAVTLCLLAALVTIAFLLENPWRFPERRDLPSVRLDVMLHGNKASKSIRAEVTLPANETTQIKIFHDTNLRQLLSVFPLTSGLDIDALQVLPGLANTLSWQTAGKVPSVSRTMVPQGLAVSTNWIFVSAYDSSYEANSVIYMIDRATGVLAKTIVLQGQPHVGGLAYDIRYDRLWICGQRGGKAELMVVSLRKLEAYPSDATNPLVYDERVVLAQPRRASFVSYHDGSIYVGVFYADKKSRLYRYKLTWSGELSDRTARHATDTYSIPKHAQGAYLTDDCLFVSQSYGHKPSHLYVYPVGEAGKIDTGEAVGSFELPPMLEDIDGADGTLYTLHESGAAVYRTRYGVGVDRVVTYPIDQLVAGLEVTQ